jgi:hypothetical protein
VAEWQAVDLVRVVNQKGRLPPTAALARHDTRTRTVGVWFVCPEQRRSLGPSEAGKLSAKPSSRVVGQWHGWLTRIPLSQPRNDPDVTYTLQYPPTSTSYCTPGHRFFPVVPLLLPISTTSPSGSRALQAPPCALTSPSPRTNPFLHTPTPSSHHFSHSGLDRPLETSHEAEKQGAMPWGPVVEYHGRHIY